MKKFRANTSPQSKSLPRDLTRVGKVQHLARAGAYFFFEKPILALKKKRFDPLPNKRLLDTPLDPETLLLGGTEFNTS